MQELVQFFSYAFVQKALFAGVVVASISAFLGVFILLKRLAFFTDAIAHSSLLGVALGFVLAIHPTLAAITMSMMVGIFVASLAQKQKLASDTIVGVIFSTSVALAIFLVSILDRVTVDLTSLLFGDILAVSELDIALALMAFFLTLLFLRFFTKAMLKSTFSREIALIENKGIVWMEYVFLALLGFIIAISIKMVGAILVSALIIIPAATAQNLSNNIRQMFLFSVIIGIMSVVFGMFFSFFFDSPSGSTIVLTAGCFFLLSFLFRK